MSGSLGPVNAAPAPASPTTPTARPAWPAAVCDLVCVLVFTVVGTLSHDTAGVGHVALVGLPFVVGLAVGWLATRAWRAPAQVWPTGVANHTATPVGHTCAGARQARVASQPTASPTTNGSPTSATCPTPAVSWLSVPTTVNTSTQTRSQTAAGHAGRAVGVVGEAGAGAAFTGPRLPLTARAPRRRSPARPARRRPTGPRRSRRPARS